MINGGMRLAGGKTEIGEGGEGYRLSILGRGDKNATGIYTNIDSKCSKRVLIRWGGEMMGGGRWGDSGPLGSCSSSCVR